MVSRCGYEEAYAAAERLSWATIARLWSLAPRLRRLARGRMEHLSTHAQPVQQNGAVNLSDHPELSVRSLLYTLWKHKLPVGIIWALTTLTVVTVTYRLPTIYRAETVILVESQKIPEKYVSSTVNADLQDRLNSISQQILSSGQLLETVRKFNLYPEEQQISPPEEIIRRMRDDVTISMESRGRKDRPSAFRISYQGRDPKAVTDVANYIGGLFIDQNLRTREGQATGTSEFLEDQLGQAKARLEEQEAKLSVYKLKYNGELPEQENSLIATAGQIQVQLQGVQDAINRAEQQKAILENSLETAKVSMETLAQTTGLAGVAAAGPVETAPPPPSPVEQLRTELQALRMRYTANHPDVKRAEAELARAERLEAAQVPGRRADEPAPVSQKDLAGASVRLQIGESLMRERERVENLKAQIQATATQLQTLQADRTRLLDRINSYQKRIERLPIREQQLATVSRDYAISKASYQSLLDKKLTANVATEMEKHQQPERFTMLDPARVPQRPVKPDRPLLSVLGGLGGLLLGLAFSVGRQFKQNVILGEWELPGGAWILGRIPLIVPGAVDPPRRDSADRKKAGRVQKWRLVVVSSSLLLVLGVIIAAGVYFGRV
jgi:succinoglycan biosynthesis transport protein ExoP